ncbi:hypothetical protein DENSPDRAFT_90201 [Dentipellis sp. KUC8613]|nr:hypothetical protein DENSPDRAFT_90201 [Dentipellis sp. KUC8613]
MSTPTAAPPAPLVLFARGTIARLALWPALRVAVAENWGGPPATSAQKQTWLASVLVDAFEPALISSSSSPDPTPASPTPTPVSTPATEAPDADYVALTLLQVLEDEFDAVLEDGSADTVAQEIVGLYGSIARGEPAAEARVREWEARAETWRGKKVQVQEVVGSEEEWESEEDEEDEEGEGEEAPQLRDAGAEARSRPEPVVDEDGFTLVQGKGKGRAPR